MGALPEICAWRRFSSVRELCGYLPSSRLASRPPENSAPVPYFVTGSKGRKTRGEKIGTGAFRSCASALANYSEPSARKLKVRHAPIFKIIVQDIFMKRIVAVLVIVACAFGTRASAQGTSTNAASAGAGTQAVATNHIKLTLIKVDSEEVDGENGRGTNAVDGNPETIWHTEWQDATPEHPHEIIIKLNEPTTLKGFTYLPRQDDSENGTIKDYEFYLSDDGKDFGQPVKKGTLDSGKEKKTVTFDAKKCQFIKLRALSEVNDGAWTSAAEIDVITAD